jgi:hypothetical protein
MLKRCQVLFEDWQMEYLNHLADIYDLSFSEAVRMSISFGFICAISVLHPEFKPGIDKKSIQKASNRKLPEEELHKLLSKLYFETRKAVEYRMTKAPEKKPIQKGTKKS